MAASLDQPSELSPVKTAEDRQEPPRRSLGEARRGDLRVAGGGEEFVGTGVYGTKKLIVNRGIGLSELWRPLVQTVFRAKYIANHSVSGEILLTRQ